MQIDLLHIASCPNVAVVRQRLREAGEQLHLTIDVREVEVTTTEEANRLGMHGSPTILLDGRDPFPGSPPSVSCRLYNNAGAAEGAPSVESLVDVLRP